MSDIRWRMERYEYAKDLLEEKESELADVMRPIARALRPDLSRWFGYEKTESKGNGDFIITMSSDSDAFTILVPKAIIDAPDPLEAIRLMHEEFKRIHDAAKEAERQAQQEKAAKDKYEQFLALKAEFEPMLLMGGPLNK